MPRRAIGTAIHDDTGHMGSAKRNAVNGLAGLSAAGKVINQDGTIVQDSSMKDVAGGLATFDASKRLLAGAQRLLFTVDGSNLYWLGQVADTDLAFALQRMAANDYQAYINEAGVSKRIQTASMKDVANGIVAQDASGNAAVTGSAILLTRTGLNNTYLIERTSGEQMLLINRIGVNAYKFYKNPNGTNLLIPSLDANGDIPHMRPKVASANLRHSLDNVNGFTYTVYTKIRTFTFSNGISGTLRIAFDIFGDGSSTAFGQLKNNGVNIGAEQSTASATPVTKTQDINVGVLAPGDTIELWVYRSGGLSMSEQNFRIYYDNAADTVAVAGVTTSSP